ncbi:MAG: bifunctional oligoribonuclease/PAP phosphatase NrnA [Candidatus Omnitrophota bacterium]
MNLNPIIKAIKANKTFVLTTHANPDVDALTSELALAIYLRSLGKIVHVINADAPLKVYRFLPKINWVKKYNGKPLRYDVAIFLDCADFSRIGSVEGLIDREKMIINIDHHITNEKFGCLNFVDSQASSAAEMVFTFLKSVRYKLTKDIAILLYSGIMTDTGSFRYDNTSPYTHQVVSELLTFKFSANQIYRKIYEAVNLKDLVILAKILDRFEIHHQGKVVCIELTKQILKGFSGEFDLRDKIFTFLRAIQGIEVVVIFTENKGDFTRVNFRSQGKVDVSRVASKYNGGGHAKASGGYLAMSLKKAKKEVLRYLSKVVC